jgi:hypothetical protein
LQTGGEERGLRRDLSLLNSEEADAVQYRQWEWPLRMITLCALQATLIIPASATTSCAARGDATLHAPQRQLTVAIELPIWLAEIDIAALEHQHGAALAPRMVRPRETGHIDFSQVRNGAVHILD